MNIYLSKFIDFFASDNDTGIIVLDQDRIIKDVSNTALTLLEKSFSELIDQNAASALQELHENGQQMIIGDVKLKYNKYIHTRTVVIPEEGTELILLKDRSKHVLHDIYLRVLNLLSESLVISDENGYIIQINDSCVKSEGHINSNVCGKHLSEVYTVDDEDGYLSDTVRKTRKSLLDRRHTYGTHGGKKLDVMINVHPLLINDKVFGGVCIMEDYSKIDVLSKKILELQSMLSDNKARTQKNALVAQYSFNDIVSCDPQIVSCIKKCKRASAYDSAVLIYGETGTGKELFAQSIHNHSLRANNPFVAINCAAIPENLLEGLIFGTAKGAYTGAEDRQGLLEQAHTGTLLLDEINSMSMVLQSKLLRVLQDGCVRRLGSDKEIRVDVRIISNINILPQEAIRLGLLRQDLFYRLGVVNISIPPLRERPRDIELLTKNFILNCNKKMRKNVVDISPDTLMLFKNYSWPGNVRELEHAIEHAMNILPDDKSLITSRYLPEHLLVITDTLAAPDGPLSNKRSSAKVWNMPEANSEQLALTRILYQYNGNISHAAEALGISRQNLQYRLKKYNIHVTRSF